MAIMINKPGMLTSLQDLGRYTYQQYGVIVSGSMDPFAHTAANLLVGNSEGEATLEVTLTGPKLTFGIDTFIAICGADLTPSLNEKAIENWRTISVRKGDVLEFGNCKWGCRAYIAVAGGYDTGRVMGSKSTYLRAGMGGYQGRALKEGDTLPVNSDGNGFHPTSFNWFISHEPRAMYLDMNTIRAVKGRHFDLFTKESQTAFFNEKFKISTQSDRMGYRAEGTELKLQQQKEILSEPVLFGTVQVPSEGKPIILMADRQTTGGYPKIAQVAYVDLPKLAQAKPGDSIVFQEITEEEAQISYIIQKIELDYLKAGIRLKNRE
ncbi:biotin-dependent carboxyltransferase family protein [Fictibacillus terranigra]|uniref:Biotin-dependent carboxyltransferase family protein n=1 Tax=Fictibacillus terranigra TaxID=3058424 RepID=A0ABT8E5L6_9BACL|nr:biotin-dependent carboxyltransferase family protein [Fictibacillus sp. CENA-BCM004]MDN4073195.1 biotin-dependent carboxyltransferase family protein [Fictibacillus sp. CENA-BCM004]